MSIPGLAHLNAVDLWRLDDHPGRLRDVSESLEPAEKELIAIDAYIATLSSVEREGDGG